MPSGGFRENAGRPEGSLSVNILSAPVKKKLLETFNEMQKRGKQDMIKWAEENPTHFYKLICSLIPLDINLQNNIYFGKSQINISKDGEKISLEIKENDIKLIEDIQHEEI